MLHWNLLGKNCILPTLRSIRAAALPAFRRFPRVICPASSGSLSYGGQVASRNDVGEHCSPDVAQRNPGLTRRRPRIALRSIWACMGTWLSRGVIDQGMLFPWSLAWSAMRS